MCVGGADERIRFSYYCMMIAIMQIVIGFIIRIFNTGERRAVGELTTHTGGP